MGTISRNFVLHLTWRSRGTPGRPPNGAGCACSCPEKKKSLFSGIFFLLFFTHRFVSHNGGPNYSRDRLPKNPHEESHSPAVPFSKEAFSKLESFSLFPFSPLSFLPTTFSPFSRLEGGEGRDLGGGEKVV